MPAEDPAPAKPSTPVVEEKKVFIYAIATLSMVLSHMDITCPTQKLHWMYFLVDHIACQTSYKGRADEGVPENT